MHSIYEYETEIGILRILDDGDAIIGITLAGERPLPEGVLFRQTRLSQEAARQIRQYLLHRRKTFSLPIAPEGTPFQQLVWRELLHIPYGETRSYQDIAQHVGRPKGYRAVGLASNRNPIMIVIPCHRVIGTNGRLKGYAGGVELKERLLRLEGSLL